MGELGAAQQGEVRPGWRPWKVRDSRARRRRRWRGEQVTWQGHGRARVSLGEGGLRQTRGAMPTWPWFGRARWPAVYGTVTARERNERERNKD